MSTTNNIRTFRPISPMDALLRSKQYPSTCIIGPSGVGKTAFINAVFNTNLSKVLKVGVGDKNQTTLFTCNFVLDSRIHEDRFALKVYTKPFDSKRITTIVVDAVYDLFCKKDYCAIDTVEDINDTWFLNHVIEPAKATYRLSAISEQLNLPVLKDSLLIILKNIENTSGDTSFEDLLRERKKDPSLKSFKASEIRQQLFTSLWDIQNEEIQMQFKGWLKSVEAIIWKDFKELFKCEKEDSFPLELLLDGIITEDEKASALKKIFDPKAPYSLIIHEAYLACRPNEELYQMNPYDQGHPPFRLCLRDTVGVNQSANDLETIREGIEVGLTYQTNSILILLNLEDRDDTLKPFCNIIHDQLKKRTLKQRTLIQVLFTKGDKLIGTRISQRTNNLVIGQEDYNEHIISAVLEVENKVSQFVEMIGKCNANWLSLRYYKTEDDPIQKAMQDNNNLKKLEDLKESGQIILMAEDAFKPSGLYKILEQMTKEVLESMLPPGMIKPHFVSVQEPNKPVIELHVDKSKIFDKIQNIKKMLTQDKMNVNSYLLPLKPVGPNFLQISPWTVNAYWNKLQHGLGHNSKADPGKYLNININMKGLLYRFLAENLYIGELYNLKALSTTAETLEGDLNELEAILQALQVTEQQKEKAFQGWNPVLLKGIQPFKQCEQILHSKLQEYFLHEYRQFQILDKVALQLTSGNNVVSQRLQTVYYAQYSHDLSMRRVQNEFYEIFSSDEFNDLLAAEIGNAMTEMINKLFIAV